MKAKLALQLWSVKKAFQADYKETLKKVAQLGFDGVEFAGFYNVPAEDMKAELDKNGLEACGSHTPIEMILNNLGYVITYNKIIGNKHIICPFAKMETKEELFELIENVKPAIEVLEANGMHFGYHNHHHEFVKFDDEFALDILFNELPKAKPEIDTYWVFNAGQNNSEYCPKYTGRLELLHLKDGTATESRAIGEGEVDIQAVIDLADKMDAKWVVMEDESKDPEEFESVEIGMNNLKNKYKL